MRFYTLVQQKLVKYHLPGKAALPKVNVGAVVLQFDQIKTEKSIEIAK